MRTFKEDLEKDLRDPEFAKIFHKEWRTMTDTTYDNVTVRKEKDSVVFTDAERCFPMKRSTFMAIVADNVKSVMKPNDEPWEDNATIAIDSTTLEV